MRQSLRQSDLQRAQPLLQSTQQTPGLGPASRRPALWGASGRIALAVVLLAHTARAVSQLQGTKKVLRVLSWCPFNLSSTCTWTVLPFRCKARRLHTSFGILGSSLPLSQLVCHNGHHIVGCAATPQSWLLACHSQQGPPHALIFDAGSNQLPHLLKIFDGPARGKPG